MTRTIVAGLDGSPESLAAADWAAREALRRGLPLRLLHAWTPEPARHGGRPAEGADPQRRRAERIPREAEAALRPHYPELRIEAVTVAGEPADALPAAAQDGELLVLGSRGLGSVAGFLVGSVALPVVAHTVRPVVLVRAGETAPGEQLPEGSGITPAGAPHRDVVLGLDLERPADDVLGFAFEAAASRGATLRVVHGWNLPAYSGFSAAAMAPGLTEELETLENDALAAALGPWREKYPDVTVDARALIGPAARHLVGAAADASLVVVGRRIRGTRTRLALGPVVHALMHHSAAPVAVVPHP